VSLAKAVGWRGSSVPFRINPQQLKIQTAEDRFVSDNNHPKRNVDSAEKGVMSANDPTLIRDAAAVLKTNDFVPSCQRINQDGGLNKCNLYRRAVLPV
jgi:hypothetical protein